MKALCGFPECSHPHSARGYCDSHCRQLRLGRALTPLRKKLPNGTIAALNAKGLSWCSCCRTEQPLDNFHRNVATQSGYCHYCRSCQATLNRSRLYGLTAEQVSNLPTTCENINCDNPATDVDHCHDTDEYLGMLCGECNRSRGMLANDSERIRGLAEYNDRVLAGRLRLVA